MALAMNTMRMSRTMLATHRICETVRIEAAAAPAPTTRRHARRIWFAGTGPSHGTAVPEV